jgi:hypothetical protein
MLKLFLWMGIMWAGRFLKKTSIIIRYRLFTASVKVLEVKPKEKYLCFRGLEKALSLYAIKAQRFQ